MQLKKALNIRIDGEQVTTKITLLSHIHLTSMVEQNTDTGKADFVVDCVTGFSIFNGGPSTWEDAVANARDNWGMNRSMLIELAIQWKHTTAQFVAA